MSSLLSIVCFIPTVAAGILALFLRGDDPDSQNNAKWLALEADLIPMFLIIGIWGAKRSEAAF